MPSRVMQLLLIYLVEIVVNDEVIPKSLAIILQSAVSACRYTLRIIVISAAIM